MQQINLYLIQQRIEAAHKNFLDSVGEMPQKITADQKLFLTRTVTRIKSILDCFVKVGVINRVEQQVERNEGDDSCCVFRLTKKGFSKAVYIWTDGLNINIKTAHYPQRSGLDLAEALIMRDIDFDSYNWVEFADKLLYFIHLVIYERKKSFEIKIFERIAQHD